MPDWCRESGVYWESWSLNGEACITGLDPPFAGGARLGGFPNVARALIPESMQPDARCNRGVRRTIGNSILSLFAMPSPRIAQRCAKFHRAFCNVEKRVLPDPIRRRQRGDWVSAVGRLAASQNVRKGSAWTLSKRTFKLTPNSQCHDIAAIIHKICFWITAPVLT